MLHSGNEYTVQVLYRTGFKWPLTTDGYLDKFISLLSRAWILSGGNSECMRGTAI